MAREDLRHQCEGTRSTVDGEPFRCPIRLNEPGRRFCGRCSLAIEHDGEDAVRWPGLSEVSDGD